MSKAMASAGSGGVAVHRPCQRMGPWTTWFGVKRTAQEVLEGVGVTLLADLEGAAGLEHLALGVSELVDDPVTYPSSRSSSASS